ncbi:hypothetical protein LXO06_01370 [Escherichia coli]|nr:hypothetical protein [Escherichia coli]
MVTKDVYIIKKNDNDALEGNGDCNNFYSENKESFFWLMIERGIKFYRKEYLTTITEKNIMIS